MTSCKAPMALLRILLGIQMFLHGVFGLFTSFEIVSFSRWLPQNLEVVVNLVVVLTGLVVLIPCLAEVWAFSKMDCVKRNYRLPALLRLVAKGRTTGYAFSGCMWIVLWYFGLLDGGLSSLDFLGPVYISFVIGLYISDARTQRRVNCGYEKRRPFVVLY